MFPSPLAPRCIVFANVIGAEVVCGTSPTRVLRGSLCLHLPRFLEISFITSWEHSIGLLKYKRKYTFIMLSHSNFSIYLLQYQVHILKIPDSITSPFMIYWDIKSLRLKDNKSPGQWSYQNKNKVCFVSIPTTPNIEIMLSLLKYLVIFMLVSVTHCCELNWIPQWDMLNSKF